MPANDSPTTCSMRVGSMPVRSKNKASVTARSVIGYSRKNRLNMVACGPARKKPAQPAVRNPSYARLGRARNPALCGGLPQTCLVGVVPVVPSRSYGVCDWRWAVMTRVASRQLSNGMRPDGRARMASRKSASGLLLKDEGCTDGVVDEIVCKENDEPDP